MGRSTQKGKYGLRMATMKELLDKLRLWLIVKLGGFTQQQIYSKTIVHKTVPPGSVRRLRFDVVIGKEELISWPLGKANYIHQARKKVAQRMVDELMGPDGILFIARDDVKNDGWILRGELAILSGKALAWSLPPAGGQAMEAPPPIRDHLLDEYCFWGGAEHG